LEIEWFTFVQNMDFHSLRSQVAVDLELCSWPIAMGMTNYVADGLMQCHTDRVGHVLLQSPGLADSFHKRTGYRQEA
jgi:hypothetical protein